MDARLSARRVALVALLVAAPALGEGRGHYGGSLTASLLGAPATLDPALARSHAELTVAALLYDRLYDDDGSGALVPSLAAALPSLGADGREARIVVRRDLRFHDGSALTADDVVASLERARKLAGSPLGFVRAAKVDGDAVVLELARPTAELVAALALPAASVTPNGKPPGAHPIGSGPFAFVARDEGAGELDLAAFDDAPSGRPYVDALILRWFTGADDEARGYEAGQADFSLRGAIAFAGHQPKYATSVVASGATVMIYLGFGKAHARLTASVDFRQAVSLALGRDGLRTLGSGERVAPSISPLAEDLGGAASTRAELTADPSAAKIALARAAEHVPVLATPAELSLEVLVDQSRPDDREVGEKAVAALFRLGLKATISELAPVEWARRTAKGDGDLFVGHLAASSTEPALVIAAAFAAGGDGWAAAELAKAPLAVDAALARFAERLPVVPVLHRAIRLHHRATIHRVGFDGLGRVRFADLFEVTP